MKSVFIGLGSNLDEPLSQLNKAIEQLKQLKTLTFIKASNFYSSPPMGPQDQPDYINAVVKVHWGARTLDLDILLFGNEVINSERLIVPHCGISERNFVLYPLSDLVDLNFKIPSLGVMSELLAACSISGLTRLTE